MSFFYDLNKRLANLANTQEQKQIAEAKKVEAVAKSPLTQALNEGDYSAKKAAAGKDIGKPGKNFAKIAKGAAARYGSKEAGERVAGAVLNKLRHPSESVEQDKADAITANTDMKLVRDLRNRGLNDKQIQRKMKQLKHGTTKSVKEATCNECGMYESKCKCPGVEEGNAFTGALAKTPKGGKFKLGDKEFKDTSSIEEADVTGLGEEEMEEGYAEMDAWLKSREKEKGTGRFDKKKISTGTVYTRKPETFDEPSDDEDTPAVKGRKKVGAGKGKKIGAKVRGTSKLHKLGAIAEDGEYDAEGEMAKGQIHTIVRHAKELEAILHDNENLPEWVQEKLGQIKGMMTTVADYMLSNREQDIEHHTGEEGVTIVPEVAPPGAKAERMVKHIKKAYAKDGKLSDKEKSIAYATAWKAKKAGKVEEEGSKPDFLDVDKDGNKKESFKKAVADKEDNKAERAGKKVTKDIEYDEGHKGKDDDKAEKAGKKVTKDIEYDDKKDKEEKVDETTTSGSVATAPAAPKSSKGGMQFGKGVYESLNTQFKQALTESIQVQETVAECGMEGGEPGITIQASGEDAMKLMQLLKLAGLTGDDQMVDENSPDWPTNTEKIDAEPNLRTYSGGLNGPKSTGQTTTVGGGIPNRDERRQASMEESVELERSLFKLYHNYKAK